jgi:hypothetical protein
MAVDDYRFEHPELAPAEKLRLNNLSNQLSNISTRFTLEDVGNVIASIKGEVNQIKNVSAQAKNMLARLNTVSKVVQASRQLSLWVCRLKAEMSAGSWGN